MSAIEVLKEMLEYDIEESLIRTQRAGKEIERELKPEIINALSEAIVALKQKEDDRKKGALEELKRIEEAWHHIGSKGVCNYIEKRIKELSGETK